MGRRTIEEQTFAWRRRTPRSAMEPCGVPPGLSSEARAGGMTHGGIRCTVWFGAAPTLWVGPETGKRGLRRGPPRHLRARLSGRAAHEHRALSPPAWLGRDSWSNSASVARAWRPRCTPERNTVPQGLRTLAAARHQNSPPAERTHSGAEQLFDDKSPYKTTCRVRSDQGSRPRRGQADSKTAGSRVQVAKPGGARMPGRDLVPSSRLLRTAAESYQGVGRAADRRAGLVHDVG